MTGCSDGKGGQTINVGNRPIISGAVWLSKPANYTTRPDYLSTNTINIATLPAGYGEISDTTFNSGSTGYIKFTFNSTKGATNTTIWVGIWVEEVSNSWYGYQQTMSTDTNWIYQGPSGNVNINKYSNTSGFRRFKFNFGTDSIVPPIEAASILITDWSPIVRYDKANAGFITWNKVSSQNSKTTQHINGSEVTNPVNSKDEAGTKNITPSDYSIDKGKSYTFKAIRSNNHSTTNTASDQITLYTYTHPELSNLVIDSPSFTVQNKVINANHELGLKWNSNPPANDNIATQPSSGKTPAKTTSDKHKTVLKIKDTVTSEVDNTSTGTTVPTSTTITADNLKKYVPFDITKTTGEEVTVKLTKSHADDSEITAAEQEIKITVRYIPTESPTWPTAPGETGYKINNSKGLVIQENAAVDRAEVDYIYTYFNYPSGEYGIIDGYEVRIISQDKSAIKYDIPTTNNLSPNLSPSIRIPTSDIKFGMGNTIEIKAYYKHTDGTLHYGPPLTKKFPSIITRLSKPTITYPAEGSQWINEKFRILMTLPYDPDWNGYTDDIKNTYSYRDMQIEITGNNITKTYTWSNPDHAKIFSLERLASHQAKIAINPSLMSDYPKASSYKIRVRVRKGYGYLDSQEEASWSRWSNYNLSNNHQDYRTVKVLAATHKVNRGDYIMASHFNKLKPLMDRMRGTYPTYTVTTKTVKVGDYILDEDFPAPYNDILKCMDAVNTWGNYSASRSSVKFNNGNKLPTFTTQEGEYITALADDKAFPGRNYITLMFDYANLLK